MEIIKKNVIINRPVNCGNTEIGVDSDIIVPDIKPDILKILQVDGKAIVCNTELSEGRLTVSGRIDLNILYVPDREGEKIKSIETSFDFLHNMDKQKIMPDMQVCAEAEISKLDFHVLNSRKLRVKTTVELDYEISEQASLEIATGTEEKNAENLITPIEITSLLDLKHSEFNVRETFELPPGHSIIEEILKFDVKISDFEYKVISGRVALKGTVNLNCLYLDTDCMVKCCDFETSFTELFDISGADDETNCDISFFVKEASLRPGTDADGDARILLLDTEIAVRIVATKKISTDILVDCFLPGNSTELVKSSAELESVISAGFYQTTLREIISADSNCPKLKGIYNVFSTPIIEKSEVLDDKISVSGKISCCILYIAESDETPIYSMKKDIPFSCMIDTPKSKPGMNCSVDARLIHTSYNLNPANEAEVRCILTISAKISEKNTLEIIDTVETNPIEESLKKGIVLYFVQKNDSIWDISKRYCVSQDDILKINNLENSALISEGMKILIPAV